MAAPLGETRKELVDARDLAPVARDETQRLLDAERRPDAPALRHVRDAAPRDPVRREAADLLAAQLDAAARRDQPGDRVAQRRLAHAVAADDREHAALEHEVDALQHMRVAVVDVEMPDLQHRRTGP